MTFKEILFNCIDFLSKYSPITIVLFVVVILSVIAGLYCFALYCEEKPSQGRTTIKVLIYANLIQILICFKFLPFYLVLLLLISYITYYFISLDIPYIKLTSPMFIATIFFTLLSHIVFTLQFLLSDEYLAGRFVFINLFLLWSVPCLIFSSITFQTQQLIGDHLDGEREHKNFYIKFVKFLFGKLAKFFEENESK